MQRSAFLASRPPFGFLSKRSMPRPRPRPNLRPDPREGWRDAAIVGAIAITCAWVLGGHWYIRFYPAEKAVILKGPRPFAHNIFMETKEHLLLAIAVRERRNRLRRQVALLRGSVL